MGPFLYSTNPKIKFDVYQRYVGGRHYVWCSEFCDSRESLLHPGGGITPPSANPAEIYEQLWVATMERPDWHDPNISRVKAALMQRIVIWATDGTISNTDAQEITYRLDHAESRDWRPLLYVINRAAVVDRMQIVPINRRASPAPEYVVPDLARNEFDVIHL